MKKFIDFYRLRDHINRPACLLFNPAQDTIVPICDRPDLRMHLRYRSIPGLLLNQALMTELAHHCAYCHCAIAARSIRKHYRDCHAQLLTYEPLLPGVASTETAGRSDLPVGTDDVFEVGGGSHLADFHPQGRRQRRRTLRQSPDQDDPPRSREILSRRS